MPFSKGDKNINRNGRPPGSLSITALVKEALLKKSNGEDGKSFVQQFVEKLLTKAIKDGDNPTQKLIWNYIDGLPKESLDITSLGEKIAGINYIKPDGDNIKTDDKTGSGVAETPG